MRHPKTILAALLAGATLFAPLGQLAQADNPPKSDADKTKRADQTLAQALAEQAMLTKAIQRAIRAFVFVGARGSAVLISPDGYILTNDHVAGNRPTWRVRTVDGTTYEAKMVGTDPYGDIALLKIESDKPLPFIQLKDSDSCKVGETVIAVGNPFGMSNIDERPTVTVGVISALNRPQIRKGLPDSVMTDAPINPGNSGGPLISLDGRLVGINGQIHTRHETRSNTGIGYAISTTQIKRFIPMLKAADGGMVRHGWIKGLGFHNEDGGPALGVQLLWHQRFGDRVKRLLATNGLKVARVPDSLKGQLEAGDVITHVDDYQTLAPQHTLARILSYPAGAKVTLTVKRGDETRKVDVTLDAWPIRGRPDLGVNYLTAGGVRLEVGAVAKDSQADKAGFQTGDHVLSIAGIELAAPSAAALMHLRGQLHQMFAIRFGGTGAEVEVSIMRKGKPMQLILEFPKDYRRTTKYPFAELVDGEQDDEKKKALRAEHFHIGFGLRTPKAAATEVRAMQVQSLVDGGPAQRAGIKPGDVILAVKRGDKEVSVTSERQLLIALLRDLQASAGQKITVLVERDGKKTALELTLGLKRALD